MSLMKPWQIYIAIICVACLLLQPRQASAQDSTDVQHNVVAPLLKAYDFSSSPLRRIDAAIETQIQLEKFRAKQAGKRQSKKLPLSQSAIDRTLRLLTRVVIVTSLKQDSQKPFDVDPADLVKIKHRSQFCQIFFYRGQSELARRRYSRAINYLSKAKHFAKFGDLPRWEVKIENALGICLHRLGATNVAAASYRRAWLLAREKKLPDLLFNAATNYASAAIELKNYTAAENAYLSIGPTQHPVQDLTITVGLANVALQRKDFVRARALIDRAAKMECHKTVARLGQMKMMEAKIEWADGNLKQALQFCDTAIAYYNRIAEVPPLQDTRLPITSIQVQKAELVRYQILIQLGQHNAGLQGIVDLLDHIKDEPFRHKAHVKLAKMFARTKQFSSAYNYSKLSKDIKEQHDAKSDWYKSLVDNSKQNIEEARKIDAQQTLAMTSRKHLSEQRKQKMAQNQSTANFRYLMLLSFCIFTISVLGICLLVQRNRHERRLKESEQIRNTKLNELVESKSAELIRKAEEQAELEKSLERKRRDEAIGKLTGCVAHDFNNLLQVILSTNELLQDEANLSGFEKEMLGISSKSIETGSKIVKQLLSYAGQQKLAPQVLNVSNYFEQTSSLLHAAVHQRCQLKIDDATWDSCVLLDPAQLTTSLINLLSNAVDATPEGGEIRIAASTVTVDESPDRRWSELPPGQYIQMSVEDPGIGMTQEVKQNALEPFFTTKATSTGTGLGLSSVSGFVKQSGGSMKIEDQPSGGVCVSMIFPLTTQTPPSTPETLKELQERALCSVLVVEDNAAVGETISQKIQSLGFECELQTNAKSAIETLNEGATYDLVISDIRMPGDMDGFEFRDWILENHPKLEVILMSGFYSNSVSSGDTPILEKPFSETQLLRAIELALSTQAATLPS